MPSECFQNKGMDNPYILISQILGNSNITSISVLICVTLNIYRERNFRKVKITNKIMGVIAVFIVIMFLGTSMQTSIAKGYQNNATPDMGLGQVHGNTVPNMKMSQDYRSYFIANPVNLTDQFSNALILWLMNKEKANPYNGGNIRDFHMYGKLKMKNLLSQFLRDDPSAVILLQKITAQEKLKFAMQNYLVHKEFIAMLNSGKLNSTQKYSIKNNNSIYVFFKPNSLNPTPPSYVLSTNAKWDMITIAYFTASYWHPGPWWAPWAGYWVPYNYGEQDTINTIYSGNAAQNYYNSVTGFPGGTLTLSGMITSVLTGLLIGLSIGTYIGAIIGAVVGIGFWIVTGLLSSEYSNIYQSTFSDQNWGHKYMWMFLISDYYYPWEPLSYYSNSGFSVSGYLSNGNVQGILPQISTGTVVGAYISQGANNFVNSHGQNNFVNMGC